MTTYYLEKNIAVLVVICFPQGFFPFKVSNLARGGWGENSRDIHISMKIVNTFFFERQKLLTF